MGEGMRRKGNNRKHEERKLSMAFLNMQGGRKEGKWKEMVEDIKEENVDIMMVVETHLREDESPPIRNLDYN